MVSRVVCIRHGKPESSGYAEDTLRPLSAEGRSIQVTVTKKIRDSGIKPDRLLTSPLLRSQQTAEVVTEIFGTPIENEPALGNDFDADNLLSKIPPSNTNLTLFLVGHAPTLGQFVNELVGKNVLPLGLSKSSAAIVEFSDDVAYGKGKLIDYLTP